MCDPEPTGPEANSGRSKEKKRKTRTSDKKRKESSFVPSSSPRFFVVSGIEALELPYIAAPYEGERKLGAKKGPEMYYRKG